MKNLYLILLSAVFFAATSCIREDDMPVKIPPMNGAVIEPAVGGASEPNQVWINLATGEQKITPREGWDLGFYCGDHFKVILNYSLIMSAGKIENATNIDSVNSQSVANLKPLVQTANFAENAQYIDSPTGNINANPTAVSEININDNQNNVYLVNLGFKTFSGTTNPGSVYSVGDARGWKKIRVLRTGNGYKIHYAGLDETTHKEFIIEKNPDYNFKYFSFTTNNLADIEPKKNAWDICFTVFTNLVNLPGTNSQTSYIFPDAVLHNILGNVSAYEVVTATGQGETEFKNFKKENIDTSKFVMGDRRIIGSNWRTTTGPNGAEVYNNKFYVLKNSDGFYFKLRFLRMKNDQNYRGFPQFEYKPL